MANKSVTIEINGKNRSGQAFRGAERDIARLSGQVKGLSSSLLALGGVAIGFAGITEATRQASEFSTALAEVSTLLDDVSQVDGLREAVEGLAREYGGDVVTNTRALYNIISAGASDAAEATELLATANRLAIGGVTDVATAADGLTSILNAYGLSAGEAASVSDALFVAMRAGKTTIGELSQTIGQVAPLASSAGVAFDELLASVSAITKGGVSTAQAMTQVRAVLSAVIKPSTEAVKTANQLGIEFNLAAIRAQGFSAWLSEIGARTNGNQAALGKLFGQVEGLQAVLALTGNSAGDFADILGAMEDRAGQTAIAVEKMADSPAVLAARFDAAVSEIQRSIGNLAITSLADDLEYVVDNFDDLADAAGIVSAALLAVFGGRLVSAIVAWGAAQTHTARATRVAAAATLDSLRAKEAEALAARSAAVANLGMARAMDQATGGMARQAVAAREVAAAHTAYAAAAARTAAATRNASVGLAAGRGALALLGGPLGAITTGLLLGATAWATYGSSVEEAKQSFEDLTLETERLLGNFAAIESAQLNQQIDKISASIASIRGQISAAESELQNQQYGRDEARNQRLRERAIELRKQIAALDEQEIQRGGELVKLRQKLAEVQTQQSQAESGQGGTAAGVATENTQIADAIKARDKLLKELEAINDKLTAGPDPAEQTSSFNIAELNTLRGQAGGKLERGDTAGALEDLSRAKTIIDALATSGEVSTGYLQTQIKLVSDLAGSIKETDPTPKVDEAAATQDLQSYAELRDQFLQQNPGAVLMHVDEEDSLARLQAAIERLQAEASRNAITVPLAPAGPGVAENAPQLATGGPVRGPGSGTSDSILSWLSNGEYVIKAAAVRRYGLGFISRLNAMQVPRYAAGGPVPRVPTVNASAAAGQPMGAPLTLVIDGKSTTVNVSGDSVPDLRKMLARESARRGSR